jgi:hypothetical protein
MFRWWHTPRSNQPFGTTADTGKKRLDQNTLAYLAGPDLGVIGGCAP